MREFRRHRVGVTAAASPLVAVTVAALVISFPLNPSAPEEKPVAAGSSETMPPTAPAPRTETPDATSTPGPVTPTVAFAPAGNKTLASAGLDKTVRLWAVCPDPPRHGHTFGAR